MSKFRNGHGNVLKKISRQQDFSQDQDLSKDKFENFHKIKTRSYLKDLRNKLLNMPEKKTPLLLAHVLISNKRRYHYHLIYSNLI